MDVNFLPDKKNKIHSGAVKPEEKKIEQWSEPIKDSPAFDERGGVFENLSKFGIKKENSAVEKTDYNKIKDLRKEMLRSISDEKKTQSLQEPKEKAVKSISNFFKSLSLKINGNFKKKLESKRMLAEYNTALRSEKELLKSPVSAIGEMPRRQNIEEELSKSEKSLNDEPLKSERIEDSSKILKTNLIKGEAVIFFNWRKNIIIFSTSTLLIIAILIFANFGITRWAHNRSNKNFDLVSESQKVKSELETSRSQLAQVKIFQQKLELADSLLEKHVYWTNFFKFLEDYTLTGLYFINFRGDTKGKYSLSAVTKDYDYITAQIKTLRSNENVIEASVAQASISQGDSGVGAVNFELKLSIDPKIFYK